MVLPHDIPHDGITREEIHHRQIDMRGYRRSDGLFEVTASLADRKTSDFTPPGGTRTVAALSPIHDLGVTLVFDVDMVVRAVSTFIRSQPRPIRRWSACGGRRSTPATEKASRSRSTVAMRMARRAIS